MIPRHLLLLLAGLVAAVSTGLGQLPAKTEMRPQDIVPAGNWKPTPNGRIDAKTGIPRALYFVDYGPLSGTPEAMARTYLQNNSALLHLQSEGSDLRVEKVVESPMGYHINFEQVYGDVPLYRSGTVVTVERSTNKVVFYVSEYKPSVSVASTIPAFSAESAFDRAVIHLNARGIEREFSDSRLMINADGSVARLSYRVTFPARDPFGDWEVFVDALTGEIFSVVDRTVYHKPPDGEHVKVRANGSGYGWAPDPLTQAQVWYGTPGYIDPGGGCVPDPTTPELDAQRIVLALPDITFSGGVYKLEGPFVNVMDWDSPTVPVATAAHPDSFRFNREQSGFEDVMVYHHIDASQRYIQSLGFLNIQNGPIVSDPHGAACADNSYFQPSSNRLAWGEGGVDDAEDADVVLHEYGHAIQYGSHPGWGGGESGALGEGFGDYWARSYGRFVSAFGWQRVFKWDAGTKPDLTGQFWPGRQCNDPRHYPPGGVGGWQIHDAGQIWSTVLMEIWGDIGREVIDKCILQSHFLLGSSPTMRDNAAAVIQANRSLYGGAHVAAMVNRFGTRNFVDPTQYIPQIVHTPLTDTEDLNGPYLVTATITQGAAGLDPAQLKVHWGRTGAFTDSVQLAPTGTPTQYSVQIPGNGVSATYRYYIIAGDSSGATSTHPIGAPANFHTFHAGLDTIAPVIAHIPLRDQALIRWPARVRASVTDNIGIDSVWVDFVRIRGTLTGSFPLLLSSGSTYEGLFPLDTTDLEIGDSIYYKVIAKDVSTTGNIGVSPATGFHKFAIISARGVVLVIDNDPATDAFIPSDKGVDNRPVSEKGAASRLIVRTLDQLGFVVDTAGFATHDTSLYQGFDVVVWSAGSKTSDIFGDAAKRAALVNFSHAGGKIWVEGGEVGYIFRKSGTTTDLDPPFRRSVLHDSVWISDVSSSNMVITNPSHPMFTTPNIIAGPVPFPSSGIGHRDAMRLIPGDTGAKKIAGWSTYATQGPDTAAIIVYNPLPDPNVGQIVFHLFSVAAITDTAVAKDLIENTAEFLMARPGGAYIVPQPSALNFGAVQLGDSLTLPVSIKNVGTGSLEVTNITNANPLLTVVPTSFTLGSQETVLVNVTFKPVATGNMIDTLRFVSNASNPPVIPVRGRGGMPVVSVWPDSFYFALPSTHDTTTTGLLIRNTGEDTLSFTIEELSGSTTLSMLRSTEQQPSYHLPKGIADSRTGSPQTLGGGGPDAFGYIWIDSDEPGGPQFDWTDIRPMGTQITSWSGSADDGYAVVTLPFAFRFYGNEYSSVKVVTNGFLSFDVASSNTAYTNTAIPATAQPNNGLFAWWDDLNLTSSGTVHYYADVANSRFIVQYTAVPHYGTTEPGVYTFQVILKSGGDVLYQYLDMQQTLNSATIGIENAAGSIGLQVVFNAAYMHNNLAIRFTRDAVAWMSTNVTAGIVAPHDSITVNLHMHPGPLAVGNYHGRLKLAGNIPDVMYIPVHLYATGTVGVEEAGGIPTEFSLMQNYPNPFNPVTSIKYALPHASHVSLIVYNLLGQQVSLLVNEVKDAGYHQVPLDGQNLSSGVYFYRIEAGSFVAIKKLILLK